MHGVWYCTEQFFRHMASKESTECMHMYYTSVLQDGFLPLGFIWCGDTNTTYRRPVIRCTQVITSRPVYIHHVELHYHTGFVKMQLQLKRTWDAYFPIIKHLNSFDTPSEILNLPEHSTRLFKTIRTVDFFSLVIWCSEQVLWSWPIRKCSISSVCRR